LAKQFLRIEPAQRKFILKQKIFFNASATTNSRVNLSPRDVASPRILDDITVAYLDLTGSGNETAAHLRADGRLTLMFCSFEGAPLVLRLYGRGRIVARRSAEYRALLASHFSGEDRLGARQMVVLEVDRVQTSCGYGVPLFQFAGHRDTLTRWAEAKGQDGLELYWRQKNLRSIDDLPTGLLAEAQD
jgi:hypothetical protein